MSKYGKLKYMPYNLNLMNPTSYLTQVGASSYWSGIIKVLYSILVSVGFNLTWS